jgi:hypothetical protein
MSKRNLIQRNTNSEFVLGAECFEKFSAVEGIFLTPQEKQLFAEMDRKNLSNDQRREIVLARFQEAGRSVIVMPRTMAKMRESQWCKLAPKPL